MDGRDLVAVIIAVTFTLTITGRMLLAYIYPEVVTPTENLTLWIDLFNTLAGGLLVYIGSRFHK